MLWNGIINISINFEIKFNQKVTECRKLYVILRAWPLVKAPLINNEVLSTEGNLHLILPFINRFTMWNFIQKTYRKHASKLPWEILQTVRQQKGRTCEHYKRAKKPLCFIVWKSLFLYIGKMFFGISFYLVQLNMIKHNWYGKR